jgi:hypothetical protein
MPRVRGEIRVVAPNATESQNSPSPAFRWIQGAELAERAGMRQCLECSDLRSVLSLRSERGVAGSVTHLDALLSQRLALLQILILPVRLDLLEML